MKVVVSHPTGNNFCRALITGLLERDMLAAFHTSVAIFPGSLLHRLASGPLAEFSRREYDLRLKPLTNASPVWEIGRMAASKFGLKTLTQHESGIFSVDAVYRHLDRQVAASLEKAAANGASAVYAYEDGALETFREAKRLGLKCIYDLPIAYWESGRKLMQNDALRLPEWAITLGGGIKDSPAKLKRKQEELDLADCVVVPGSFVKDSLPPSAAGKEIVVAPFGTPQGAPPPQQLSRENGPLRVLFAGSMSQRKGLGDLFAAVRLLNRDDLELVVMGAPQTQIEFYRQQLPNFTFEPGRPNEAVLELMSSCDVFCLPSIVEGRALVMQEAMSRYLPVIITPNTGGADLVVEGETGFLVPVASPEAIASKLLWCLENRDRLPQMGRMARTHAMRYTWEGYVEKIIEALN